MYVTTHAWHLFADDPELRRQTLAGIALAISTEYRAAVVALAETTGTLGVVESQKHFLHAECPHPAEQELRNKCSNIERRSP